MRRQNGFDRWGAKVKRASEAIAIILLFWELWLNCCLDNRFSFWRQFLQFLVFWMTVCAAFSPRPVTTWICRYFYQCKWRFSCSIVCQRKELHFIKLYSNLKMIFLNCVSSNIKIVKHELINWSLKTGMKNLWHNFF